MRSETSRVDVNSGVVHGAHEAKDAMSTPSETIASGAKRSTQPGTANDTNTKDDADATHQDSVVEVESGQRLHIHDTTTYQQRASLGEDTESQISGLSTEQQAIVMDKLYQMTGAMQHDSQTSDSVLPEQAIQDNTISQEELDGMAYAENESNQDSIMSEIEFSSMHATHNTQIPLQDDTCSGEHNSTAGLSPVQSRSLHNDESHNIIGQLPTRNPDNTSPQAENSSSGTSISLSSQDPRTSMRALTENSEHMKSVQDRPTQVEKPCEHQTIENNTQNTNNTNSFSALDMSTKSCVSEDTSPSESRIKSDVVEQDTVVSRGLTQLPVGAESFEDLTSLNEPRTRHIPPRNDVALQVAANIGYDQNSPHRHQSSEKENFRPQDTCADTVIHDRTSATHFQKFTDVLDDKRTPPSLHLLPDADQLPDISYEQSFLPPHLEDDPPRKFLPAILKSGSIQPTCKEQPHARVLTTLQAKPFSDNTPVRFRRVDHDRSDGTDASKGFIRALDSQESEDTFATPGPSNPKEWETPAATKQYMEELPTRTAIARRVESFQIPPERLAALQPEIAAIQDQQRKPSDKLSLKESSAQIDALLNENWGLKMKIMFMDQHFEQDREKAELIAENVKLQTNGFNFVQQVKARDKTIRSLQKKIEDLEFRSAGLGVDGYVQAQTEHMEQEMDQKIQELEHYINILELEHDKVVHDLEAQLAGISQSETGMDSGTSEISRQDKSVIEPEYETKTVKELKSSLNQAEAELEQLEEEYKLRLSEFQHIIEDRDRDIGEYRDKLGELSADLKLAEYDLENNDHLRNQTIEELREIYESERIEYELYIEDRHEEIDILKQAIKSYNQDSFEMRLSEAIKPHEQAWAELNQQYEVLRLDAEEKDEIYLESLHELRIQLEDRNLLNSHLSDTLKRRELEDKQKNDTIVHLKRAIKELELELDQRRLNSVSVDREVNSQCTPQAQILEQSEITELKEKNCTLAIELASRKELLTCLQQDIEEVKERNAQLETQSEIDQQQITELEALCEQYQEEISGLHAELDESKHTSDHREVELRQEIEQANSALLQAQQELTCCKEESTAQVSSLQNDCQRVSDELSTIEKVVLSFTDINTNMEISSALQTFLERITLDCVNLRESVNSTTLAHEGLAVELRKSERISHQNSIELKSVRKQLVSSAQIQADLQQNLNLQNTQLGSARKSLIDAQQEYLLARRTLEQNLHESESLSRTFIANFESVLGYSKDNTSKSKAGQDLTDPKDVFQSLLHDVAQRLRRSSTSSRSQEVLFKQQIAELESVILAKTSAEGESRVKLQELRNELDSTRLQQKEQPFSAHTDSKVKYDSTNSRPSLLESINRTSGEEYWTLHERIRVLTQDLKYQKELREQDDKAAKVRLAEAKSERRKLLEKVRKLRGSGETCQEALTIGITSGEGTIEG